MVNDFDQSIQNVRRAGTQDKQDGEADYRYSFGIHDFSKGLSPAGQKYIIKKPPPMKEGAKLTFLRCDVV